MTVVVDTNVFVSSFFGGKPREVVDGWKRGTYRLGLSEPILDEYVRVLRSMELDEKELQDLLELFRRQYNLTYTAETPDFAVVDADPDDDKFIEAAVALDADTIVTGDTELRAVERYMTIPIQTPNEFLKEQR